MVVNKIYKVNKITLEFTDIELTEQFLKITDN